MGAMVVGVIVEVYFVVVSVEAVFVLVNVFAFCKGCILQSQRRKGNVFLVWHSQFPLEIWQNHCRMNFKNLYKVTPDG